MKIDQTYVLPFEVTGLRDIALVGGKNASLGELTSQLKDRGRLRVPPGFAVTTSAFHATLTEKIRDKITELLEGLDKSDLRDFARRGKAIRSLIYKAPLPDDVAEAIRTAYRQMEKAHGKGVAVAVRSSATAEDLPGVSFAGQHESYLFIRGVTEVLDACRRCFASLFTDRAMSYRIDNGFDHMAVALSVGVQKMVHADKASSGVIFTIDPDSGFRDVVVINGVWGLGEAIVQGMVDPDEFTIHKPTFRKGHRQVLRHRRGSKERKMVFSSVKGAVGTRLEKVSKAKRAIYCLDEADILELADAALVIEDHYSRAAGEATPMDIEWAKDGPDGPLYIIQARPETVYGGKARGMQQIFTLRGKGKTVAAGTAVGAKIATGTARLITSPADLAGVKAGDILVSAETSPDWEPVLKRAAAVVTDHGGRTCHAAIVAREIGIPAVVGTGDGTASIPNGATVTVSCAEGEIGRVLSGAIPFDVRDVDTTSLKLPKTRVMINAGNPDQAFKLAALPSAGVGLARTEFIVTEAVKAHPMALLYPDRVKGKRNRAAIEQLISGHPSGADYFVEKLSEGIATLAAAFYPRPVIVRTSDFKSNEYASLLGGAAFEENESNPMIGFRGAARYVHPAYAEAFALECRALARVRDEMGLTNVKVMIPFCRRVGEADAVLDAMAKAGLKRGLNGLEIYVMCEIPSNVLSVDEFAKRFDGFSIGSNDLTQLTLGVDRDSDLVAGDFDERDPAVLSAISMAIAGTHRNGIPIGICGQAPSDYPDFCEFLVREGIDSISLTPDSLFGAIETICKAEEALARS